MNPGLWAVLAPGTAHRGPLSHVDEPPARPAG